jgi:hypothetical protein
MKKSKSLSCLEQGRKIGRLNNKVRRNFTLHSSRAEDGSADKATAFHRSSLREKALPQNACRPKLCALSVLSGVNLGSIFKVISVNLCNLWLKNVQSKITNYAKRTQFSKKSNAHNRSFSNELQRKSSFRHLVKTNPIEPNFTRHSVWRVYPLVKKIDAHPSSQYNASTIL